MSKQSLKDLEIKYKDTEFTNCDDFIKAAKEVFDVYFETIDRAVAKDGNAKEELIEALGFVYGEFSEKGELLAEKCPEKFEKFHEEYSAKMEEAEVKLELINGSTE